MKAKKFNTATEMRAFLESMEGAIRNMVEEIKKPVDPDLTGSSRKAELQAIKQTAADCKEMFRMRMETENMLRELSEGGQMEEDRDFRAGFAEKYVKK
jgi:hypothetical protein